MAGLSALRSGAGLVTWGLPMSLNDAMEAKLTEVMTKPLPETSARSLAVKALAESEALLKEATVLALGPGISTYPETAELVHQAVTTLTLPMVIDADGLNCLALKKGWKKNSKAELVLTPHPGEMARLLGITIEEVQKDRIGITERAASEFQATVVLKGAPTIIAQPGQDTFINTTGNPGMATAGSGDVLTGLIAGFMAQGLSGYSAAKLGVFVHGLAGDLAAEEKTELGMIAGDILDKVPEALKILLSEEDDHNI
jgi:NAD(P)H-hydrate epimerase